MNRRDGVDLPVELIDGDQTADVVPPRSGLRWRRWSPFLVVGVIVAIVAASRLAGGHRGPTDATNKIPATTVPAPTQSATGAAATPLAVETIDIGRPLLAVPTGWELFCRGGGLVRIQLRAGRITRTAIPTLQSTGPVYLVVGADQAVIRPLDFVTGYLVPDGQPATPLSGALGDGGPALPGPDSNHLWVASENGQRTMKLVGFDGTPTGVSIPTPDTFAAPDGTGYLLIDRDDGVYLARPAGLTRVTTGALLAAGPTRWLTAECDRQQRCHTVVTDRATGIARVLGPAQPVASPAPFAPGVISPDGKTAAIRRETPTGSVLHLLDLTSGRDHPTSVLLPRVAEGDLVWTPDSSLLFFVDRDGHLGIIDTKTTQTRDLGVELPAISQLALRVTTTTPSP